MNSAENPGKQPTYEELEQEIQSLKQELHSLRGSQENIWPILVETSRRLQISSASIKAAVTSMLNYDIFWDAANQHEFLKTIDASVDQVTSIGNLLSLAFRVEAGSLEQKIEPHFLSEILSSVLARRAGRGHPVELRTAPAMEGKPVLVDFQYLRLALELFLEVFTESGVGTRIELQAEENEQVWFLVFFGLSPELLELLATMHACKTGPLAGKLLSPENILKLHIACEVLHLQRVDVETISSPGNQAFLRLWIPIGAEK
jgi:signal transduction histidine kinase